MRICIFLPTLLFCLRSLTTPLSAQQTAPTPVEYERRIRALEDRLQKVEELLQVALAERAPDSPSPAEIAPSSAASLPTEPLPSKPRFEMPAELVPDVGKIGSQVGLLVAGASNPFKLDPGAFYGGFIDLPLLDRPGWLRGKISYEIMIGLSRSQTRLQTTSNVAQVANLAVLNSLNPLGGLSNVTDALTGTGTAPFTVTADSRVNARVLQVVPFAFKYATTALDRWRFRPYGVLGFGMYVTIHNEVAQTAGVRPDANLPPAVLTSLQQAFGGKAPFGSALVAGQISQSAELVARGLPGGNGNLDIGLQTGGGFEWRLTPTLSLGFDARFNKISGNYASFGTYGSRIGFHF